MLQSQAFIGRKKVTSLYLNNSQIESVSNQTFNGLGQLETLHLEDNYISSLMGYEFSNLTNIKRLYLQNNNLKSINETTFSTLKDLQELRLDGNGLSSLPNLDQLTSLTTVYLSGNVWPCQCQLVRKIQELSRKVLVPDLYLIHCFSSKANALVNISANLTCTDAMAVKHQEGLDGQHWHSLIPVFVGVIVVVIFVACIAVLVFIFRMPIRVCLHSKYGIRVMDSNRENQTDKMYDALVSYSIEDEEFVHQIMAPRLEEEDRQVRLCLQHRDVPRTHPNAINATLPRLLLLCAKHIIVLTNAFLRYEWNELKNFLTESSAKRQLIVIVLEEPSPLELSTSPEMRILLKTATVIRWNEAGFWNKLRFHLPDSPRWKQSHPLSPLSPMMTTNSTAAGTAVSPNNRAAGKTAVVLDECPYDTIIPSNNSSTSTRSTIMGGSPRNNNNATNTVDPGTDSVYSWQEHTYQSIPNQHNLTSRKHDDPIYHTLSDARSGGTTGTTRGQTAALGCVDVILPNGQMVPATLVRNQGGKIIPVVLDSVISNPSPGPAPMTPRGGRSRPTTAATGLPPLPPVLSSQAYPDEYQPLQQMEQQQVIFPRTVVYTPHSQDTTNIKR